MPNLVELIKQISEETNKAGQPTDIVYGTVVSASPVSIMIDQKTTLTSDFIVLTKNVTNYQVDMTFSSITEKVIIKNELKVGDKVIMIRQAGGQSYIVLDKIGG